MATIRKRNNRYEAQVRKQGHRPVSKSFDRKSHAVAWARKIESEIERGLYVDPTTAQSVTLGELLDRAALIPPNDCAKKRSRISVIKRYLGHCSLYDLTSSVLAEYRDRRLRVVGSQTIIHELSLINRVLKLAVMEWEIELPKGIPIVRKPKLPRGRDRRLLPGEEQKLLATLSKSNEMPSIVVLAIETAMRRGEIMAMDWSDIDFEKRTLHIPETKTDVPRTIPLTRLAVRILKARGRMMSGRVFSMRAESVTGAFDRACKRAGIEDLRFHDLRHEAASRLFEKGLGVMEVASITGHRDLRMLRRYTHLRAEDLVSKVG